MEDSIGVVVQGPSCYGKSTVAEAIRQTLEKLGFEVVLLDDNGIGVVDERPGVIQATLNDRLRGINMRKEPLKVNIRTKQAPRGRSRKVTEL